MWPEEGGQIRSRVGVFPQQILLVLTLYRGKKLLLDSVPLLMKIRDFILLTAAQAGFAPEACRLTLPFPDEAGLAGWIALGGLVLRCPEFVAVQPVTASLEKLLLLAVTRVTVLLASKQHPNCGCCCVYQ